jgi:hypothetical protein
MPFAQLAYKQFVGSSHLGINEIGCFLVSNANTLEKVGVHIDPPTLNTFYTQHKLYTYDLTDRANDDITWSTVTKYCPQLVVNQIGGAGFPNSDLAQVEFRYKSHTGATVTHFCAVNSAADHSIIDSWDGKVKTPAEYQQYYGQPIAWATFIFHTPQTTPAGVHSAPVSAPAAAVPPSQPAPQPAPPAPSKLYLPPSVWIWHVYKEGGPYTLPYAIGALDPKMFNGLTYDIIGNPAPHVYLIQTQTFGRVAIYAGPDTVAQFPGTGHGEGESTDNPAPDTGVPVNEAVPAPVSAPAIVYTRFPESMQLVTKPGAHAVNFESGTIVKDFDPDTPFVAVGKATFPDNVTYYMDNNNFGIADQTQRTPIMVGIKVIDLSPPPKPESASVTSSTASSEPVISTSTATAPYDISETSLPWQKTFTAFMGPMKYIVKDDMKVYDFATGNDEKDVSRGDPITVGGKFQYAGALYYRAQSSIDKGTWYGFPVTALVKQDANNTPFNTHDDINQLGSEIESINKAKHIAIKAGGTADGLLARFKLKRSS